MDVILKKDIDKIGKAGSVIKVKEGFARNFLFPRKWAAPATAANLKRIEQEKQRNENLNLRKKEQALNLSQRLTNISITIPVQVNDDDKLYGSISSLDILDSLKQEGISDITKDAIIFDEQIKSTGVFDIAIKLHPEVIAKVKLWVVKK